MWKQRYVMHAQLETFLLMEIMLCSNKFWMQKHLIYLLLLPTATDGFQINAVEFLDLVSLHPGDLFLRNKQVEVVTTGVKASGSGMTKNVCPTQTLATRHTLRMWYCGTWVVFQFAFLLPVQYIKRQLSPRASLQHTSEIVRSCYTQCYLIYRTEFLANCNIVKVGFVVRNKTEDNNAFSPYISEGGYTLTVCTGFI